ncbi:MAG: hypothetical protein ACRDGD_09135 [Candidatus Limnocylindria bacterium]
MTTLRDPGSARRQLRSDIAGAHAAGLTASWLNRDGVMLPDDADAADLVVSSLDELAPHILASRAAGH